MKRIQYVLFIAVMLFMPACSISSRKSSISSVYFSLESYFNNDGISYNSNRNDGNLDTVKNPSGSTFPAEQLPASNSIVPISGVQGVMAVFPSKEDGAVNNIACKGQLLEGFMQLKCDAVYIIGCGTMGDQSGMFKFRYRDGTIDTVELTFIDWCRREHNIEDTVAFKCSHRHNYRGRDEDLPCSLYCVKADIQGAKFLTAVQLPDNSNIHIFSMTPVSE